MAFGTPGATPQDGETLRFDELLSVAAEPAPLEPFRPRDGAPLELRRYPSPQAPRLLLLVHGSGADSRYLAGLARDLARRQVAEVWTPDLRGHGRAPTRRGDVDYEDQLVDDLADLARRAREEHPGRRLVVGGHSSGGGLAIRYGGGGGDADEFLLLAPYLSHDAPTIRENAGGWARPYVGRIVGLSLLNALGIRRWNHLTVIDFDLPERLRSGVETLAYSYRLNTGLAPRDWRRDLARIDADGRPVALLVGDRDDAFVAERYAPALQPVAPAAQVKRLPGVSHMGIVVDAGAWPRIAVSLARE